MKKDFDFESIGKQTPYVTPEHFFEDMQQKVWIATGQKHRSRMRRLRIGLFSVVSMAAVWLIVAWLWPFSSVPSAVTVTCEEPVWVSQSGTTVLEPVSGWIKNLSDEELEELVSCSEIDLFLMESQS